MPSFTVHRHPVLAVPLPGLRRCPRRMVPTVERSEDEPLSHPKARRRGFGFHRAARLDRQHRARWRRLDHRPARAGLDPPPARLLKPAPPLASSRRGWYETPRNSQPRLPLHPFILVVRILTGPASAGPLFFPGIAYLGLPLAPTQMRRHDGPALFAQNRYAEKESAPAPRFGCHGRFSTPALPGLATAEPDAPPQSEGR